MSPRRVRGPEEERGDLPLETCRLAVTQPSPTSSKGGAERQRAPQPEPSLATAPAKSRIVFKGQREIEPTKPAIELVQL
jgi:hypothetical protein